MPNKWGSWKDFEEMVKKAKKALNKINKTWEKKFNGRGDIPTQMQYSRLRHDRKI